MRELKREEMNQRGCNYCLIMKRVKGTYGNGIKRWIKALTMCPCEECPFHELDKFDDYDDYLKSIGVKFDIEDEE